MFTEAHFRAAGLGWCLPHIRRRHRGGRAASDGLTYEDFFSVGALLEGMRLHRRRPPRSSVKRGTFAIVDDVVTRNGHLGFHQLRRGIRVRWAQVVDDFVQQEQLCTHVGLPFRLYLVVARQNLRMQLAASVPPVLARSSVLFFPAMVRVSDLARPGSPSASALRALSADSPGTSDLEAIARAVWAFWADRDPDAFVDAVAVLNYLRQHSDLKIWFPFVDTSPLWTAARTQLENIPGLRVAMRGGHLWYRYARTDRGHICRAGTARYRRFLQRVVASAPMTFDEFEALLP